MLTNTENATKPTPTNINAAAETNSVTTTKTKTDYKGEVKTKLSKPSPTQGIRWCKTRCTNYTT